MFSFWPLTDVKSGIEIVGDDNTAKADYKYDAVLHKNPDANIFKILSNRYMKTGVKNLFEDQLKEGCMGKNLKWQGMRVLDR